METRQELAEQLHQLEKRLDTLEAEFRGLKQVSLTLEATLEVFAERGLLSRELMDRFKRAMEPQRERIGQYSDAAVHEFVYSLLDEFMESLDEAKMPHG